MSHTHFHKGDLVEVTRSDHGGSTGPYYPATVLRPVTKDKAHIFVLYQTLTVDGGPKPLTEFVELGSVRPAPPRELHRLFKVGDDVDDFRAKGWSRGTVREILENSKYLVVLDGQADQEFESDHFNLRLHREWDDGSWVPPLPEELELQQKSSGVVKCRKITFKLRDKKETMGENFENGTLVDDQADQEFESEQFNLRLHKEWDDRSWVSPLPEEQKSSGKVKYRKIRFTLKAKKETVRANFENGTLVEVSSDEEGYKDAWYTARIVEYIGKGKFLVEYVSLLTEDRTQLLREEAFASYIRPCPPPLPPVAQFKLLQKVDAWYNEGWWEGSISKVLTGSKYVVYFSSTNEELEFNHSNLRLHQDWLNGHWVMDPCYDFYGF